MKIKHILCFLFFVNLLPTIQAKHVIGGYISYQCLGNDYYDLEMRLFRDCSGGGAQLDDSITFTIYSLIDSNYTLFNTINVKISDVINTQDIPADCSVPGICQQVGIYKTTVRLPFINSSFIVSYQRCCLVAGISNIEGIVGDTGMTITTEITALAQKECNSSPLLHRPPIVTCVNKLFLYDFAASDIDADSIAYHLCAPYNGGGNNFGNLTNTCVGIIPIPSCPPPYQEITYKTGFAANVPLGDALAFTLHPSKGLLSGTPNQVGRFLVGVCVSEFRAGKKLSTTKASFSFIVDKTTAVSELEPQKLSIIPNPIQDNTITWKIPSERLILGYSLMDIQGKIVKTLNYPKNTLASSGIITIEDIATGVYILQLNTDNGSFRTKVVW